MRIGKYELTAPVALAPMAGITDKPFRMLCRSFGAGLATSEMITSDPTLQQTRKTLSRKDHSGEDGVISVQIAGSDPIEMAKAAKLNVENGAQIIDINMGCPAKKVCNVLAGSALLKDEALVSDILHSVVSAVSVPVTLKTRLGWDDEHLNVPNIAQMAQKAGIAALAIHGRSRTQMYKGEASYDLIAQVRDELAMPLWVNGDIDSAKKAQQVLQTTQADGVMIGRAAQGAPWIFRDVVHYLQHGVLPKPLTVEEITEVILTHINAIHQFYGDIAGTRIARKHINWYLQPLACGKMTSKAINLIQSADEQLTALKHYLQMQKQQLDAWPIAQP